MHHSVSKYPPAKPGALICEPHVDNPISGPKLFVQTNVMGTFTLLEAGRRGVDVVLRRTQCEEDLPVYRIAKETEKRLL